MSISDDQRIPFRSWPQRFKEGFLVIEPGGLKGGVGSGILKIRVEEGGVVL